MTLQLTMLQKIYILVIGSQENHPIEMCYRKHPQNTISKNKKRADPAKQFFFSSELYSQPNTKIIISKRAGLPNHTHACTYAHTHTHTHWCTTYQLKAAFWGCHSSAVIKVFCPTKIRTWPTCQRHTIIINIMRYPHHRDHQHYPHDMLCRYWPPADDPTLGFYRCWK